MNDFALQLGEIRALFDVCSADEGAAGPHDAAAFALLFGTGNACGAQRGSACNWKTTMP